ncbi:MAG: hypothetical protein BM558_01455 [Roseobacter sp. MedPE-SW]|nr:MAG: hypothetical protein BM558_01455 [Roseobacter sp. MedPE-SW]
MRGGVAQVFLAQALFRQPRVLLLGEPTAALDLRHLLLVLERLRLIASQNGTIIGMAMHDLNFAAQYSDHVLGLDGGRKIASGAPAKVLTPETLRIMYRIEAQVPQDAGSPQQILPLRAI